MTEIRFGLVGCGRIGSSADESAATWAVADLWLPYSHAGAIKVTDQARLVAVCDIDERAVADAKRRHGVLFGYRDFRCMLEEQQLDAVAIATRTSQRKAIILAALEHKVRGLYCEKPLSNSLEDADEIAAAVNAAGAYFIYGTKRRYMPTYARVRLAISEGGIGIPESTVIWMGFGSLLWTYPHAVDLASYFAFDAEVESVQADLGLAHSGSDVHLVDADPTIRSATIRFRNGMTSIILPGGGMDVEIIGRGGLVRVEGDGYQVRWRRRREDGRDLGWLLHESIEDRGIPSSGTQRSIEALVKAIATGAHPGYSVDDAVRNQEVLFAMVESHLRGGIRIPMPLTRRGLTITGRTGDLFA